MHSILMASGLFLGFLFSYRYCRFVVLDCIWWKVCDDVCVVIWVFVRRVVGISFSIWGYYYGDCVWIFLCN